MSAFSARCRLIERDLPPRTLLRLLPRTLLRVLPRTLVRFPLRTVVRFPLRTLLRLPPRTLVRLPLHPLLRLPLRLLLHPLLRLPLRPLLRRPLRTLRRLHRFSLSGPLEGVGAKRSTEATLSKPTQWCGRRGRHIEAIITKPRQRRSTKAIAKAAEWRGSWRCRALRSPTGKNLKSACEGVGAKRSTEATLSKPTQWCGRRGRHIEAIITKPRQRRSTKAIAKAAEWRGSWRCRALRSPTGKNLKSAWNITRCQEQSILGLLGAETHFKELNKATVQENLKSAWNITRCQEQSILGLLGAETHFKELNKATVQENLKSAWNITRCQEQSILGLLGAETHFKELNEATVQGRIICRRSWGSCCRTKAISHSRESRGNHRLH